MQSVSCFDPRQAYHYRFEEDGENAANDDCVVFSMIFVQPRLARVLTADWRISIRIHIHASEDD